MSALRHALHGLAVVFALLGAALGLAVALMVAASISMRAISLLGGRPIQGDVELTQLGIALSLSLCLPWCQLQRANIIVDFFTSGLRETSQRRLDGIGALLLALMCALLAWRSAAGALAVREAGETSMILSLPMWWVYAALAPGLALAGLIATLQALTLCRGQALAELSAPGPEPR